MKYPTKYLTTYLTKHLTTYLTEYLAKYLTEYLFPLPSSFFPESFSERVLRSVRPGGGRGIRPAPRTQESIVKMRHFVVSPSPLSSKMQKYSPHVQPSRKLLASKRSRAMFFRLFSGRIVRIAYFCEIFRPEPSRLDIRPRSLKDPKLKPKTDLESIPKLDILTKYHNKIP